MAAYKSWAMLSTCKSFPRSRKLISAFWRFSFSVMLIDGQDDRDVDDMIEVAFDAFQLALHVFPDGGGQFEVMSTDGEIHTALL